MTDRAAGSRAALARDWITIWQSELAALAVDREVQEALQRAGRPLGRAPPRARAGRLTRSGRTRPARCAGAAPRPLLLHLTRAS